LESPPRHRFHRLFVEPQSQRARHPHLLRDASLIHYDLQHHHALPLRLARFFRIFGLDLLDHRRRGHTHACSIHAVAEAAIATFPEPRPDPDTHAPKSASADSAPEPRPI